MSQPLKRPFHNNLEKCPVVNHYIRGERMVFRYDNAADIIARDFATYPHHKHVGEVIQASPAPALREVLEEIIAQLS